MGRRAVSELPEQIVICRSCGELAEMAQLLLDEMASRGAWRLKVAQARRLLLEASALATEDPEAMSAEQIAERDGDEAVAQERAAKAEGF